VPVKDVEGVDDHGGRGEEAAASPRLTIGADGNQLLGQATGRGPPSCLRLRNKRAIEWRYGCALRESARSRRRRRRRHGVVSMVRWCGGVESTLNCPPEVWLMQLRLAGFRGASPPSLL